MACVSFHIPILIYRKNSVFINDDGWCLGSRQCLFMETVVCMYCIVTHCERFLGLRKSLRLKLLQCAVQGSDVATLVDYKVSKLSF